MRRYLAALVLPLALAVASCGGQPPAFPVPSSTVITAPSATGAPSNIDQVNRGMAAAEQTLTLTYRAAMAYTTLPRCGTVPFRICSDPKIAGEIRHYAIQAHNALVAARSNEANVELVARMWTAIDDFRARVPAI